MNYSKSKVSIIIPCKDEAEGLEQVIRSVKPYASEIIVIDGHSKDQTKQITRDLKVKYILDNGLGLGDGIKMGLKHASGEIIVMLDGDGSHQVTDIPKLIKPLLENEADLVVGSRKTGGSYDVNLTISGITRALGADILTSWVNYRFKTKLTDILYGFRAIHKTALEKIDLRADDFAIEQEMVVSCLKKSLKVMQVPSQEKQRAWGESKLKTITGLKLLFKLIIQLYA